MRTRTVILTVLTLFWVCLCLYGVFMVGKWGAHVVLHLIEYICGDKKQAKRDFMEIEKISIMITRFSKFCLIKDDQDSASTLVT